MAEPDMISLCGDPVLAQASILQFTITQGDTSKTYHIAKNLLREHAPKFLEFLQCNGLQKARNKAIQLCNIEIETFDMFVNWLRCRDETNLSDIMAGLLPSKYKRNSWKDLMAVIQAYMFAIKYDIAQLRHTALKRVTFYLHSHIVNLKILNILGQSRYTLGFAEEAVNYVYGHPRNFPVLRSLLVDSFCAANVEQYATTTELARYLSLFLAEVYIKLLRDEILNHLHEVIAMLQKACRYYMCREFPHDLKPLHNFRDVVQFAYMLDTTEGVSELRAALVAFFFDTYEPLASLPNLMRTFPKDFLVDVLTHRATAVIDGEGPAEVTGQKVDQQRDKDEPGKKRKR